MKFDYEEDGNVSFWKSLTKEWPIFLLEVVVAIGIAFLLVTFGLEKISVMGNSMSPLLEENDTIIINKMSYLIFSPKRNDVIVFKEEGKEHNYYSIKRVIALPGEKVQIKDGKVYIDGEEFKEKNVIDPMITGGLADEEITLEKGEYFVLGDNRNQSEDSRYSNVGMITKKEIVGKAWLRIKPSFDFISFLRIREKKQEEDVQSDSK